MRAWRLRGQTAAAARHGSYNRGLTGFKRVVGFVPATRFSLFQ